MYDFIRGTLFSAGNNFAVVDAHGVGYRMGISLNTFAALPEVGGEVLLFTHFHVTEQAQSLFGFLTEEERELFEVLISVNKIGPKVGLSVLSTLTVQQVITAVEQQDSAMFKGVSGVGPKTAQRLVLELKGKLNITVATTSKPAGTTEAPVQQAVRDEAYTALIALGYNESQVRVALNRVAEVIEEEAPVQEWITSALKVI